jgi:hypothetical protein
VKPAFLKHALVLRKALVSTWGEVVKESKAQLLSAADAGNAKKTQAALKEISALGPVLVEELGSKPEDILASAFKASSAFWIKHAAKASGKSESKIRRPARKLSSGLAAMAQVQIASFLAEFPTRIINPDIQAEIDMMVANPQTAVTDILSLKRRLELLVDADPYIDSLSQVQVARLWQVNGIQMGEADGVKRMQIEEMVGDKRCCPVCVMAHGQEIEVSRATKMIDQGLQITDPVKYNEFWAFPRFPEVQLWSPADWTNDGRFPPFHNRCRGQVRYLY